MGQWILGIHQELMIQPKQNKSQLNGVQQFTINSMEILRKLKSFQLRNVFQIFTDLWCHPQLGPTRWLTHWGQDKLAAIFGIFNYIFLNENAWILNKISLKFVPMGQINNIPALVQIMACRRPGDKLLSEPMMISLLTLICIIQPQWVNSLGIGWMHIDETMK